MSSVGAETQRLTLNALDRFTQAAARRISRRSLLAGAIASGISTAIGIPMTSPLPVGATNCNTCGAPCGTCNSQTGSCCSPNGFYCYVNTCTCSPCVQCGCCGCFYAKIVVCDDGGFSTDCPCCCFLCVDCC
jgi:hypothetical protein